jgi:hypothetical protein
VVKEPEIDLEAERPSAPPIVNQQSEVTNEEAALEADEPTEEELAAAGTDPDSPSDSGQIDSDEQAQVSFQFQE